MTESIYLYYSNNDFLLNHKIKEKINELKIDSFNVIKYDLSENSSDDVLEDLQTVSFFAEQKVVIVKNIDKINKESDTTVKKWVTYFAKPNNDVILIILVAELVAKETPIGAALFKYAFIEKVKDMDKNEYPRFVRAIFEKEKFSITDESIMLLIERTSADFTLLTQEANKLMMFAYEQKRIEKKDVLVLVTKNLEENIYELTNALLSADTKKTVEIFYDLMALNEEPLRILNNIAGKVRELMHTKLLLKKGYRKEQIAQHFRIRSGRAYYLIKNAQSINFRILEKHLEKLFELDYEIKSGQIDKKLGLELYLLGGE